MTGPVGPVVEQLHRDRADRYRAGDHARQSSTHAVANQIFNAASLFSYSDPFG